MKQQATNTFDVDVVRDITDTNAERRAAYQRKKNALVRGKAPKANYVKKVA